MCETRGFFIVTLMKVKFKLAQLNVWSHFVIGIIFWLFLFFFIRTTWTKWTKASQQWGYNSMGAWLSPSANSQVIPGDMNIIWHASRAYSQTSFQAICSRHAHDKKYLQFAFFIVCTSCYCLIGMLLLHKSITNTIFIEYQSQHTNYQLNNLKKKIYIYIYRCLCH